MRQLENVGRRRWRMRRLDGDAEQGSEQWWIIPGPAIIAFCGAHGGVERGGVSQVARR